VALQSECVSLSWSVAAAYLTSFRNKDQDKRFRRLKLLFVGTERKAYSVPLQKQTKQNKKQPERLTYFFLNRFSPKRNHKVPTASSPFPLLSLKYIPFFKFGLVP